MSKRAKVIISVVLVTVLLVVGITVPVMAQEEEPAPQVEAKGLLARVAESLGITNEELANAFKVAQQEMREEAFIRFLDKALENERITESEYDAIMAWWEARPEAVDSLFPHALGALRLRGRHMWHGCRGWGRPIPPKLAD